MKKNYFYLCFYILFMAGMSPATAQQGVEASIGEADYFVNESSEPTLTPFQEDEKAVFEFKLKKDLPIMLGGSAMTIYGFIVKAEVSPLDEDQVALLDPDDVWAFDRAATRQYRPGDAFLSDILLSASIVAPFSTLASRRVRNELAPILVMYFETITLAGGFTNLSKGIFMRKRPYVYNPNVPMADKLTVRARHSFFSGHVSNSAAFSFLTAYLVDRYARKPAWKWAAWSGAAILPATVGYWRYTAGKHYPSDILVGYLIGAGTGILVPAIHQAQLPEEVSLNVQPLPYGLMLSLTF